MERQKSKSLSLYISDYKINVINLAWLSDAQIDLFKSDFQDVLEYLRAARLCETYEGSQKKIDHIEEILDLFKYLSGNSRFDEIKATLQSLATDTRGDIKMFDVLQATMDKKFALGRDEGIAEMQAALAKLYAQGRETDIKRALTDSEYLSVLLNAHSK